MSIKIVTLFFLKVAIYLSRHSLSLSFLDGGRIPDHPSLRKSVCLLDLHPWAYSALEEAKRLTGGTVFADVFP